MTRSISRRLILIGAAAMLSACQPSADVKPDAGATHIYLVRHAEKLKGDNPSLTPHGHERAKALAVQIKDKPITKIYSSDYARTLQTAEPSALALGLPVTLYDPRDLEGLAARLLASGETALVVGHSNTTPQLAGFLGGDAGAPIIEKTEYDRFYTLVISDDGTVTTQISRYP